MTNNSKINGGGAAHRIYHGASPWQTVIDNSNVFTYSNAQGHGKFHEHNTVDLDRRARRYTRRIPMTTMIQTNYFPVGTTAQEALANMNLGTALNSPLP